MSAASSGVAEPMTGRIVIRGTDVINGAPTRMAIPTS